MLVIGRSVIVGHMWDWASRDYRSCVGLSLQGLKILCGIDPSGIIDPVWASGFRIIDPAWDWSFRDVQCEVRPPGIVGPPGKASLHALKSHLKTFRLAVETAVETAIA